MTQRIAVYGATGHTGRFVVAELVRQGFTPIVSGRDAEALKTQWPDFEARPATVDDSHALDAALIGAAAVINAAGPFALTGAAVSAAAVRAGIPYVDVAAEIEANVDTFAAHRDATTPIVPAMAFYGGLSDLLVTAALGNRTSADEVIVAYGLSSWHPTPGTRTAGKISHDRRNGRRVRFADGELRYHDDQPSQEDWPFPEPLGTRRVIKEFTMADVVTIPSHLDVPSIRTAMTLEAAGDLAQPDTPAPKAVDDHGRSDQTFVVDVLIRTPEGDLRTTAHGQDIYAITAPLAVGAVRRLLAGEGRATGVASAGAMFDPADFLNELAPYVTVSSSVPPGGLALGNQFGGPVGE
ncbi:saccharopine dehydrogenase NADP-binding domain-containing protein [Kribbella albertanoniae]|uniref:Saccharopine dehydrogenase n=1 Tax=Kribbella albertanoniae TaxID=1266829 RepID=A0A4R4Q190_9ACTN|nr:saccharopine dehydrogenase NADP-binding domain-containing protein [Kribbella albertanoniae]TDC28559.1 saccharopine dehydrogenase [Kribbella albertanoniae]